ncbi:DUF3859 domain-containing protein [Wenxinia saemankumensis]|uniref:DUF3859 domain-containing protein n=1 Tax=Wenxinia saemankumensis TaxID=1447782 RepID=A0A1M6EES6_9RHOB|nr:DUF3859 domain-containing protein [Wenxinia saemankumensis]SHI83965.1 protein of unknown function [Wenxinia saemankumensis]
MKRHLAAAAILAAFGATAARAEQIGASVAAWQAGVVCAGEFGQSGSAADIAFIARTQTVPAVVGMGFGIRAQVNVPGGVPDATITVDHPPFTPGGPTREQYSAGLSDQGMSGFFYRFETPQEAAVGNWTVTASANGVVIYSLDFEVVQARQGDGLLQACGM